MALITNIAPTANPDVYDVQYDDGYSHQVHSSALDQSELERFGFLTPPEAAPGLTPADVQAGATFNQLQQALTPLPQEPLGGAGAHSPQAYIGGEGLGGEDILAAPTAPTVMSDAAPPAPAIIAPEQVAPAPGSTSAETRQLHQQVIQPPEPEPVPAPAPRPRVPENVPSPEEDATRRAERIYQGWRGGSHWESGIHGMSPELWSFLQQPENDQLLRALHAMPPGAQQEAARSGRIGMTPFGGLFNMDADSLGPQGGGGGAGRPARLQAEFEGTRPIPMWMRAQYDDAVNRAGEANRVLMEAISGGHEKAADLALTELAEAEVIREQMQARLQEAHESTTLQLRAMNELAEQMESRTISADSFYANRGHAARFGAAMSIAGNAVAQAVLGPGTPNTAMQIIDRAIQRDMQAQVMDMQRLQGAVGARQGLLAGMLRVFGSEQAAMQAFRMMRLQEARTRLGALAARTRSQEVRARYDMVLAELDRQKFAAAMDAYQNQHKWKFEWAGTPQQLPEFESMVEARRAQELARAQAEDAAVRAATEEAAFQQQLQAAQEAEGYVQPTPLQSLNQTLDGLPEVTDEELLAAGQPAVEAAQAPPRAQVRRRAPQQPAQAAAAARPAQAADAADATPEPGQGMLAFTPGGPVWVPGAVPASSALPESLPERIRDASQGGAQPPVLGIGHYTIDTDRWLSREPGERTRMRDAIESAGSVRSAAGQFLRDHRELPTITSFNVWHQGNSDAKAAFDNMLQEMLGAMGQIANSGVLNEGEREAYSEILPKNPGEMMTYLGIAPERAANDALSRIQAFYNTVGRKLVIMGQRNGVTFESPAFEPYYRRAETERQLDTRQDK